MTKYENDNNIFEPCNQIVQHKLSAFAQDSGKLSDTYDHKSTKIQDLRNVSNYLRPLFYENKKDFVGFETFLDILFSGLI